MLRDRWRTRCGTIYCAPRVQGRSGGGLWLVDGVAVGVDFVDFAYVQGADAGFDFAHIADDHPDKMIWLDVFFCYFVGISGVTARTFWVKVL